MLKKYMFKMVCDAMNWLLFPNLLRVPTINWDTREWGWFTWSFREVI